MRKLANITIAMLDNLEKKQAFIPMPGGQPPAPVMDPAAQGMPVDPAAQGMPMDPTTGQPVDPGQPFDPSLAAPAPESEPAGTPPGGPDGAALFDMITQAVRQAMQESGAGQPAATEEKPKETKESKGKNMEARLDAIEGALAQLIEMMGLASPGAAPQGGAESAAPAPGGMGMEAGQPDDGKGAVQMPMGPLDPNIQGGVAAVKQGAARARTVATIVRRLKSV